MIRALDELPLKGLRAINQMEKKNRMAIKKLAGEEVCLWACCGYRS